MTELRPSLRSDAEAWEVAEANLQLVHWTITRMPWIITDHDHEEAYADGVLGLFRAAQLFDPELGYRFATFAVVRIKAAIQKGRGSVEGANYRRSRRQGVEYESPLSLDAYVGNGDDITLADYLPGDDRTDIDGERSTITEVASEQCGDDLDRAILGHLLGGDGATLRSIAASTGVSQQTVANRRRKLTGRLRGLAADLVA